MRGQAGFFDIDERLKEISAKGDDLELRIPVIVIAASGRRKSSNPVIAIKRGMAVSP